ncbi:NAD-dependent epimerase/dehydratase family protein [Planosporangium mesophilum]|uniref:Reductase n=1 Tax=Planosporangium mesophilum TaxID=689768 RepID=A0A8J3TGF9_9ACTN|nr:NAD-dependent epimerase/dehydratase family protein [Planosporangium mesophilum]NJC81332.1 reductase [Planosporangium mesophilum]GII21015.1 reductase [Planosporangium mesophilum]
MRLLVLGGTAFLGRAFVRAAVAAGHEVTCAARGVSGEPEPGVTFVPIDRDDPEGLAPLRGMEFDALLDVSRRPDHVRRAVAELAPRVGHAVFVSSVSAYADHGTPGQRVAEAPLLAPASPDADPADPETYGPRKVACEQAFIEGFGADRVFVCRAGLIIGPEDETNRFGYWVSRLARGGEVLAPGEPGDLVQYVDVRDLADWLVRAAETRLAGVYDGTGAPVSREHFLTHVAAGVATPVRFTWVDQEFLLEQGVQPWMGEGSLPLWLPLPEYAGFLARDVSASFEAGLSTRDVADTARDTLGWLGGVARPPGEDGLSPYDEVKVLEKWHNRAY